MGRNRPASERKQEFIQNSVQLFVEKGYENTTVDDIATRMGVAKGLFYYYFKSKDAVLYSFLETYVADYFTDLENVLCNNFETPVERLWAILMPTEKVIQQTQVIISLFRERQNQQFRNIFLDVIGTQMHPVIQQVLTDSKDMGYMDIKYPEQTADALLALFIEVVSEGKLDGIKSQQEFNDRMTPYVDIMSRLLGIDMSQYRPSAEDQVYRNWHRMPKSFGLKDRF